MPEKKLSKRPKIEEQSELENIASKYSYIEE